MSSQVPLAQAKFVLVRCKITYILILMVLFGSFADEHVFLQGDESGLEDSYFALRASQAFLPSWLDETQEVIMVRMTEYETLVRHLKSNTLIIL
jgi:hypothetical protein